MNISFAQDPMFGAQTLTLEDRQLIVSGLPGVERDVAYWFRDIDPEINVYQKRFARFYVVIGIVVSLLIGAYSYLWILAFKDLNEMNILTDIALVVSVFMSAKNLKPIEVYQIRAKNGALIVQLYATKAKRFKCQDFVQDFRKRIAKQNQPNQALQHNDHDCHGSCSEQHAPRQP
jgi:hypothetical protein